MKIEFTKEDIEAIRRLCRDEILRFWNNTNKQLLEDLDKDFKEEMRIK